MNKLGFLPLLLSLGLGASVCSAQSATVYGGRVYKGGAVDLSAASSLIGPIVSAAPSGSCTGRGARVSYGAFGSVLTTSECVYAASGDTHGNWLVVSGGGAGLSAGYLAVPVGGSASGTYQGVAYTVSTSDNQSYSITSSATLLPVLPFCYIGGQNLEAGSFDGVTLSFGSAQSSGTCYLAIQGAAGNASTLLGRTPSYAALALNSVKDFGARGTALSFADGAMSNGSAVLTSSAATFTSGDIGKWAYVPGASATGTLEGLITAVTDSHHVTLSVTASASVAGATYAYGWNDAPAIQAALAALGASGGTVYFPSDTGGYLVRPADLSVSYPSSIAITTDNVALRGDPGKTVIYSRGAWSLQGGAVVRGNAVGILGGRHDITLSYLSLWGMSNGFTDTTSFPADTSTGDGWDVTHKGVFIQSDTTNTNIVVDHCTIRDFKGELMYSGGPNNDYISLLNSYLYNTNGDHASFSAKHTRVEGNVMDRTSNACIEHGVYDADASHLINGNQCSRGSLGGIQLVAVTNSIGSTEVKITNNVIDSIGLTAKSQNAGGIEIIVQSTNTGGLAGPVIVGNSCTDCLNGIVLEKVSGGMIQDNRFVIDKAGLNYIFNLVASGRQGLNSIDNTTISNNLAYRTPNAVTNGYYWGSAFDYVGASNSGASYFQTVSLTHVVIENNVFNDVGKFYSFDATSPWSNLTNKSAIWRRNTCLGCTFDSSHGAQSLTSPGAVTIYPQFDIAAVSGTNAVATATLDATKSEDGQEVRVVNTGTNPITFPGDSNVLVGGAVVLAQNQSALFRFQGSLGKWAYIESTQAAYNKFSSGLTCSTDGGCDIGVSGARFNNLTLSGQVAIGKNSANYPLDVFKTANTYAGRFASSVSALNIRVFSAFAELLTDANTQPLRLQTNGGAIGLGATCNLTTGSGSPNSVVSGSPCDLYLNTAGGAGATFWVKESGSATTTGWVGK